MRILILYFVLNRALFAQYDSTMYDLIKTTYERSFDKQIIHNYLNSDLEHNTKAALLSISQSEDTSLVSELLYLDLNKYGREVCFALAQIGSCNQSIKFLWNYLLSSPPPNQYPKIFFAIGKIGTENDLKKSVEFYNSFDATIFPYEGISEAILQFQIRGIKSDAAKAILESEILNPQSGVKRIINAFFVLTRYHGSKILLSYLEKYLDDTYFINSNHPEETEYKQFVLMSINNQLNLKRTNLIYWGEFEQTNPLLRIQFSKVLHFIKFSSDQSQNQVINYYFQLLNDSNPNVASQTAISINNIKDYLNDSLKIAVKNKIDSLLFDSTKSLSLKRELFLSRFELFGGFEEHQALLGKCPITSKYFMQFYAKNPNSKIAIKRLTEYYFYSSSFTFIIDALTEIVKIKDEIRKKIDYKRVVLSALNSHSSAPLISIAADAIDSIFIADNSNALKEIVSNQIDRYYDNPDFLEATMSLINLAEKIDKDFYTSMIKKVKSSKLYSIRKFIATKTGDKRIGYKELDKFENIWSYAFKYKQATIKTSKGNVVIEFNSEIAPISVANFCMLADKNFYDGIIFHRVVPGFVIQAGDPTGTGWGGPGYDIVSEFSDTDFGIGYVGMASAGKDTESSQFFIMQGSYPHLDSRYTLFAKVIKGMDVVFNITEDDRIILIELE
jgi:cyclophilin family peptidyl-prolyl cis-trans isomerase